MGVYGIAVLGFFPCGIAVILISTCHIAVSSRSTVCGFSSFWLTVFGERRFLTALRYRMKRAKVASIIARRISLDVGFRELKNAL